MHEVVLRRYRRLLEQGGPFPDLILIDGGKGQLTAAYAALRELGLERLVAVGIAKQEELLFTRDRAEGLALPHESAALRLIQRIRDEAHRFAVTFHRRARAKRDLRSALDDIPGIGPGGGASSCSTSGRSPVCAAPAAKSWPRSSAPRPPTRCYGIFRVRVCRSTDPGQKVPEQVPTALAPFAPETVENGPTPLLDALIIDSLNISVLLTSFVVLILSLSFHEAAHAWTANRLGDPTARLLGRLTLNPLAHIDWIGTVLFPLIAMFSGAPLIGWAKPVPVDPRHFRSPRQGFALVALAGPVSNLLLATGGALLISLMPARVFHLDDGPSVVGQMLVMLVYVNLLLAFFNLIPVPPLDGGNVLMGVVPLRVAQAVNRLRPYGFLILYALIFLGVLNALLFPIEDLLVSWLLR